MSGRMIKHHSVLAFRELSVFGVERARSEVTLVSSKNPTAERRATLGSDD